MADVSLLVTVDGDASALDRTARSLEAKGFHVERTYPRSGTILGTGDASLMEVLRSVEGVGAVRREGAFQLPPMDENIPQ